jgi:hypothetical protein
VVTLGHSNFNLRSGFYSLFKKHNFGNNTDQANQKVTNLPEFSVNWRISLCFVVLTTVITAPSENYYQMTALSIDYSTS